MPSLFGSRTTAIRRVPGTLEVLCEWSQKDLQATSSDETIAYFMLVKIILELASSKGKLMSFSDNKFLV